MPASRSDTDIESGEATRPLATLGAFGLLEFIGQGGMGDVWRARHLQTRLEVAIKIISEKHARRPKYHALFHREAQSIAALDHPGIVRLYDYGRISEQTALRTGGEFVAGSPFLAMEFCEERSLDEADPLTSWFEVKTILMSLLDGLAHAHARGVIHRDIKPGNVLVREPNSTWSGIKLADFGLAYVMELTDREPQSATRGTPAYMSPEQLQGHWRDIGPWSDLYSTGCLAWELVTGQRPFEAASLIEVSKKHVNQRPPPLEPMFPVPEGLESWLLRMLAKAPMLRFRTAAEAGWGLEQLGAPASSVSGEGRASDERSPSPPLETLPKIPDSTSEPLVRGTRPARAPSRGAMKPCRPPMPRDWKTRSERPGDRLLDPTLGLLGMRRLPLIDREELRQALWEGLAEVTREGCARTILLRGATGYGKRSLARWIAERAHETGIAAVMPLSESTTGYAEIESHVAAFFRVQDLGLEETVQRLQGYFLQLGQPRPRLSQQLARVLCSPDSEHFDRAHRTSILSRAIASVAADRPVVLVCDNLTDAPDVVDFLTRAWHGPSFRDAPLLCVGTVQVERLSEDPALEASITTLIARCDAQQFSVGRLSTHHMRRLAAHLLRLSVDVSDRVLTYAEGNPLFAIELVQHWADRDLLEWTPAGFELTKTDMRLIPAESIEFARQRLAAVVDDMDETEVYALELASMLDGGISDDVWDAVCARAAVSAPSPIVDHLVASRLAERTARGWRFAHAMIRHALRAAAEEQGIVAELHRAAADVLEDVRPDAREQIGLHHYYAGQHERALRPILDALARHRSRSQVDRGQRLLRLVDDIVDTLELPPHSRERLASVDLHAWVEMSQNQFDGLQSSLEAAIALAEEHEERDLYTTLRTRLMELFQVTGHFDDALALADEILSGSNLDFKTVFQAKVSKGKMLVRIGQTDRALELADELESHPDFASVPAGWQASLGRIEAFALLRMERLEEAVERFPEIIQKHVETGRQQGVAKIRLASANALMNLGRYEEAEEVCRSALEQARSLFPRNLQNARVHLAFALFYKGDFSEARQLLLELLGEFRRENRPFMVAYVLAGLAGIAARRHQWSTFERRHAQLLVALDESGNIDADFARVMRICADEAVADGREDLAVRVLNLSVSQLEALGLEDDLKEVRERLSKLEKPSS